ncbi:hypothetical protein AN958_00580 [Leucoagaricus sp. SymC.cos]|nr:hypothetical protein AN958_00580 [Leucoagaricus sp. SymC.cos]
MSQEDTPGIGESWRIFLAHVQPRRLFYEDPGVKGPLWFGRKPDSLWHIPANLIRIFFAIFFAPLYIFIPHTQRSFDSVLKRLLWGIEWAKTPDALLLESPGSLIGEAGKVKVASKGAYAVTGNKPRWLLEVEFRGNEIVSQKQVKYDWESEKVKKEGDGVGSKKFGRSPQSKEMRKRILKSGYTAISYAMLSAEELFFGAFGELDPQPEIPPGGKRKYNLQNRRKIAQALLDEYARARVTMDGRQDGTEFIWLDELCLSDHYVTDPQECYRQRSTELGQLADIFKGAKRVVAFCHIPDCDHSGVECPWANRLFTLGEILHTSEVLVMTRTPLPDNPKNLASSITIMSGEDFRGEMQTYAAEAKMWHLHNIMEHATNSGTVTWQSAIHSLVVEAIRRDEAGDFHDHKFLGKALNGLLPRRSQLEDLRGENGWADLAWLLELNQGYYNTTLLAAVCKLADPAVNEYRWWGKPIAPKEGSERLEALVTAIPVKLRKAGNVTAEPVLSIIGPKSVALSHWLQRDSAGLYRNPEMKSLKRWMIWGYFIFFIIGVACMGGSILGGFIVIWVATLAYVILELLVGTMFVEKDTWFVLEDHTVSGHEPYRWLQSQDPTFDNASEWGARQLIPQWDSPEPKGSAISPVSRRPYAVTLIDLRTGVFTKAAVTTRPNDMVVLAVHGSGITCMLLDRDEKKVKLTIAAKVGMANLPPFVLAQAEDSGTVYVGGNATYTSPPPFSIPSYSYPPPLSSMESGDPEKSGDMSSSSVIPHVYQRS